MSTMDDNATDDAAERTLRIKIGDRWFPAKPFGQGQIMALTMIKGLKATAVFNILSGLVRASLGEDAQGEVLVMLATQEINEHQLIAILSDVVKAAQAEKDAEAHLPQEAPVKAPPMHYGGDDTDPVPAAFGNGG